MRSGAALLIDMSRKTIGLGAFAFLVLIVEIVAVETRDRLNSGSLILLVGLFDCSDCEILLFCLDGWCKPWYWNDL